MADLESAHQSEFRDFVVTRIEAPTLLDEEPQPHERPDNDIQWTRIVELDFVPHPRLDRPEIIRMDYRMQDGAIRMRVRAAVAGISASNPFPPLPGDFKGNQVRLQFNFAYNLK